MKTVTDSDKPPSPALLERLDRVRMRRSDRVLARKHLAHAERTVDAVFNTMRAIRAVAGSWMDRIFPPAERQRDTYLAGAADRTDLERRIRNWERRPTPFQDGI